MKIRYKVKEGSPSAVAKIEVETKADQRKLEIAVGLCNKLSPVKMEELAMLNKLTF